jgi:hypothetical protein
MAIIVASYFRIVILVWRSQEKPITVVWSRTISQLLVNGKNSDLIVIQKKGPNLSPLGWYRSIIEASPNQDQQHCE